MSFKMINGFSVFSNNYLKHINEFINENVHLPKKPSLPFDDNYVNSLKSYESQTQAYFISFCNCLYHCLNNDDSNFTGVTKDAYYKIRNDYKEYKSYLRKAKRDYNESRQIERCPDQTQRDGSMSPSNPFYSIDDECSNKCTISIEPMEGDCFLEDDSEDTYINKHLKNLKKLIKIIKKRNKKRLTKNQRKKLKKRRKLDSENQNDNVFVENESSLNICESDDPQTMIQHYFKRYTQTGEWSWSMWNNYITKIQQTNPVWFDIFNRFSYQMGIDWNAMFTGDVNAQNASNVRLEVPDAMPFYRQCPNNDRNLNPDEGKSVIFTPDVKAPIDDTNSNELFCAACKHQFKSKRAFHIHLRGVRHTQNEINFVKDQKPERFITEIDKENCVVLSDMSKEEKHFQWLLYNEDNCRVPGNYFCTICKVTCTSHKDLHTHLNGQKHQVNAGPDCIDTTAILSDGNDQNSSVIKRHTKKSISRVQIILNSCTQPLIGLNFVTEYQRLDQFLECKYICDLCKVKFERKSFVQHVASQQHRETYLKYIHQDLYDILRHDLSSKSVKLKRLEVFAKEVENFEGRKKLNIMLEKEPCGGDQTEKTQNEQVNLVDTTTEKLIHNEEVSNENVPSNWINDTVFETDDKEDGEVESSDDDTGFKNTKAIAIIDAQMETEKSNLTEELEAGEIENNWSDREISNDSEKEAGELEDEIESEKSPKLNMSEFANYESIYNSERPSIDTSNVQRRPRRIEFIQLRDKKKFRLNEVTPGIIEYFKQEAIWALSGSQQNRDPYLGGNNSRCNLSHNKRDLPGGLLLPSMSQPVGPIYTGASSYYAKPKNRSSQPESADSKVSPEMEYRNIIDTIASVTGLELMGGGYDDNGLLQRVQDMLVNKDTVDGHLNEVVRQRLLDGEEGRNGAIDPGLCRRHLLPDPINVAVVSEALELLQQLTNDSNEPITVTANSNDDSGRSSAVTGTVTTEIPMRQVGDRMAKRADFLGLDQPPPPNVFPKFQSDQATTTDSCEFLIYQNSFPIMYPFVSPGMIEHHKSFAHWKPPYGHHSNNSHNVYRPYHRPNVSQSPVLSDTVSKACTGSNT